MTTSLLRIFAWLALALIVFVTVSPIGLRPHTITTVSIDRAGAFAVASLLFVLAYPKQWKLAAVLLIAGAMGMELLQYLSPTRHAHLADASVKAGGSAVGILCGYCLKSFRKS